MPVPFVLRVPFGRSSPTHLEAGQGLEFEMILLDRANLDLSYYILVLIELHFGPHRARTGRPGPDPAPSPAGGDCRLALSSWLCPPTSVPGARTRWSALDPVALAVAASELEAQGGAGESGRAGCLPGKGKWKSILEATRSSGRISNCSAAPSNGWTSRASAEDAELHSTSRAAELTRREPEGGSTDQETTPAVQPPALNVRGLVRAEAAVRAAAVGGALDGGPLCWRPRSAWAAAVALVHQVAARAILATPSV